MNYIEIFARMNREARDTNNDLYTRAIWEARDKYGKQFPSDTEQQNLAMGRVKYALGIIGQDDAEPIPGDTTHIADPNERARAEVQIFLSQELPAIAAQMQAKRGE